MAVKRKPRSVKRLRISVAAVLILAVGAGVYLHFSGQANQSVAASPYQTDLVRRGTVSQSALGSGSLAAGSQTDLSFPVEGTVGEVNVQVGDQVSAGQPLAALANTDELELAVKTAQTALAAAQKAVDEIAANAAETLANARLSLASAQSDYAEAQKNLLTYDQARCENTLTARYWFQYQDLQEDVDRWQAELDNPNTKYGQDYILEHLNAYTKQRNTAYANWNWCDSYTEQEVNESQAAYKLAVANLGLAQAEYDRLTASDGLDQTALVLAQAQLAAAQADLATAQSNLAAAVITAPTDGVVLSVAGKPGDTVGTSTFITLADLDHPVITLRMDETDLVNIAVGCPVTVSFDAIADRTFQGEVAQIDPQLASFGAGSGAIQAQVQLEEINLLAGRSLPIGLVASGEVICAEAADVLVAPLEALRTQADGSTVVYVLGADGQPEQRLVEVGLKDYANAEIISGLELGEQVILSGPGI